MNSSKTTLEDFLFKRKEMNFTADWTMAEFIATVKFLSNELLDKNIKIVCLKFSDTARFTATIFSCLAAGCEIYLPNNLTAKIREFLVERGAFWISDDEKKADFFFLLPPSISRLQKICPILKIKRGFMFLARARRAR